MTLENYISKLKQNEINLVNEIDRIMNQSSSWILKTIKLRLYQRGLDGNENKIGSYSPNTIERKRFKHQRSSFITLRDTGGFYGGMFSTWTGSNLFIDSSDEKTDLLVSLYGESILELTSFEIRFLIDTIIEPAINKFLDDNITIDLFDLP